MRPMFCKICGSLKETFFKSSFVHHVTKKRIYAESGKVFTLAFCPNCSSGR